MNDSPPASTPPTDTAAPDTGHPLDMDWAKAKRIYGRLGPIGPLALVAAFMPAVGTLLVILFGSQIAPWLREHGWAGIQLYTGLIIVLSGLALLPTQVLSLLGGWAFGMGVGLAAAMTGYLGGSTLACLAARRISGQRIPALLEKYPKWKAIHDALLGSGFWRTLGLVALIRLSMSPFAMTNVIFGATRLPWSIFWLGTAIGLTPRTAALVWVGVQVSGLSFDQARGTSNTWLVVAGIACTLAALWVISHLATRALGKLTT